MKAIICFISILCIYSCNVKIPVTYIDIDHTPAIDIQVDSIKINEIHNPFSIYSFKQYLVLMNMEPSADAPLFIYDKDSFTFCYTVGKFGRGPGEFLNCNPYYFNKTDSSFFINANGFFETEMLFQNDSVKIGKSKSILNGPANNLLRINDSLFFFENNMAEKEYSIYNVNKRKSEKEFSEFPVCKINYRAEDDRDNIFQKSCLFNKDSNTIVAFYQNIPLIRFYNSQHQLTKEIKLKNIEEETLTTDEFYQNKGKIYFSFPYSVGSKIYVLFENETLASGYKSSDSQLQVWNWNGQLEKRYHFKCKFDTFTISDDAGTFYGLNKRGEYFYFLKAKLE